MAAKFTRSSAHTSDLAAGCAPGAAETTVLGAHLVPVLGVCANLRVSGSRDQKAAAIARAQYGRVSRRQLHAAGLSNDVITRQIRQGRLHPLAGGVFAVGHPGATELGDEAAALLAVGFDAAVSHLSAAMMWDMIAPAATDGLIHVLAPVGSRSSFKGVRVHRTRWLTPADIVMQRGLPVTSPARTTLEIAELVSARQLELAVDRALVARIIRRQNVAELVKRTTGRAAGPRIRDLMQREHGSTITRSEAEELLLSLLRRARLPMPEVNARIQGFEVDFLWRAQRLVVEIDGFRFHSTRRAFEHDHRKDAALRAARLEVLRYSYSQLQTEALAIVAAVATELWTRRAD